jgi:hypothetical protein
MSEGVWLAFPQGAFEKEYQIHTTLEVGWIRTRTETGKWTYFGSAKLFGAKGKARVIRVGIEGRKYYRHRLIALAKDGTSEGLAKFLDVKNNPVLHVKRRREDERPDDRPENVDFGTHAENREDPDRKKRKNQASGHPVLLTNASTRKTASFGSVLAAATFLGANGGNLQFFHFLPACLS